jgi:hypothetical protein
MSVPKALKNFLLPSKIILGKVLAISEIKLTEKISCN